MSNEERQRVRKIKLDDLRATLEKQMTHKYVTKETAKQDNLSTGHACIMEDLRTDHMVRNSITHSCFLVEGAGNEPKTLNPRRAEEAL